MDTLKLETVLTTKSYSYNYGGTYGNTAKSAC